MSSRIANNLSSSMEIGYEIEPLMSLLSDVFTVPIIIGIFYTILKISF